MRILKPSLRCWLILKKEGILHGEIMSFMEKERSVKAFLVALKSYHHGIGLHRGMALLSFFQSRYQKPARQRQWSLSRTHESPPPPHTHKKGGLKIYRAWRSWYCQTPLGDGEKVGNFKEGAEGPWLGPQIKILALPWRRVRKEDGKEKRKKLLKNKNHQWVGGERQG